MMLSILYMGNDINNDSSYQLGSAFLGWGLIYSLYVGAVISVYGNLVSVGIEFLYKKGIIQSTWLYVLLHGAFGFLYGLVFRNLSFSIGGMVVAIIYALIDRWYQARISKQQSFIWFYLSPVFLCMLLFTFFYLRSEPLPRFGMSEAVAVASDGEGTVTDLFPKRVGTWQGEIDGYQIERETSAKEVGDETYLITFTERWKKGEDKGSWFISYEVDRWSTTAKGSKMTPPPYAN